MSAWETLLIEEYADFEQTCSPTLQRIIRDGSGNSKQHSLTKDRNGYRSSASRRVASIQHVPIRNRSLAEPRVLIKSQSRVSVTLNGKVVSSDKHQQVPSDRFLPRQGRTALSTLSTNRKLYSNSLLSKPFQPSPRPPTTRQRLKNRNLQLNNDELLFPKILWPAEAAARLETGRKCRSSFASSPKRRNNDYQKFRPQRLKSPPATAEAHAASRYRSESVDPKVKMTSRAERRYRPSKTETPETSSRVIKLASSISIRSNKRPELAFGSSKEPRLKNQPVVSGVLAANVLSSPSIVHEHSMWLHAPRTHTWKASQKEGPSLPRRDVPAQPTLNFAMSSQENPSPEISMRKMLCWEIWAYRFVFGIVLAVLNLSLLMVYLFTPQHHYVLAFLVFMKSKDSLSMVAGILGILWVPIRDIFWPPKDVKSKWIMSLVCAYAETEAQIMKTVESLVKQELSQHKQVICIILDGKPRDVLAHLTCVRFVMKGSYKTWKGVDNELEIHAGLIGEAPVLLVEKVKNAGKKDTLILGHSLFNYPRNDTPANLKILRHHIFMHVLPLLTGLKQFGAFDYVYATDADSTLHGDCLKALADALSRDPKAIAACGIIVAELEETSEWSVWHLFQQFQYTFGQYVRRQAESVWGRVTCLPGPVTMVAVRPEMAKAISDYSAPITNANLILHQVQYQGTDRRLTWCMLSQSKHLKAILVPKAVGETVVPADLEHYLSQRQRWASNAYFNDYMYAFGKEQQFVTRLFAFIDIVRMSFVYYRIMNTLLFVRSLAKDFHLIKVIPTLVLTRGPATWFLLLITVREPVLRKRLHKIICGMLLNQIMSPILSIVVFSKLLLSMGNHGTSSKAVQPVSATYPALQTPTSPWSPRRLVNIIKNAVHPPSPKKTMSQEQIVEHRNSSRPHTFNSILTRKNLPHIGGSNENDATQRLPSVPQTVSTSATSSALTPLKSLYGSSCTPNPLSTVRKRSQFHAIQSQIGNQKVPNPVLVREMKSVKFSTAVKANKEESAVWRTPMQARYPTFISPS